MKSQLMCLIVTSSLLISSTAKAALITSIPNGTEVTFPAVNYYGPGPQTVAPGITWSSTNASNQGGSVYGYTGTYGFLGNGYWDGGLGPMVGLNDSNIAYGVTDTMTFAFSTPVSAVGGFINYVPGESTPTTIAVYDANGNLIESYNLTFLTGGGDNSGMFLGFQEPIADISYFTLTDNYIAITDFTYATQVPEPSTYLVFGLAVVFALALRQRRANTRVV